MASMNFCQSFQSHAVFAVKSHPALGYSDGSAGMQHLQRPTLSYGQNQKLPWQDSCSWLKPRKKYGKTTKKWKNNEDKNKYNEIQRLQNTSNMSPYHYESEITGLNNTKREAFKYQRLSQKAMV
jgi:hypothetical protein